MRIIYNKDEYYDYLKTREAEFFTYESFLNKVDSKYPMGHIVDSIHSNLDGRRVFGKASLYVAPYLKANNPWINNPNLSYGGVELMNTTDSGIYAQFHVAEELYDWFVVAYGKSAFAVDLMLDRTYTSFTFNVGSGNNKCCVSLRSSKEDYTAMRKFSTGIRIEGFGDSDYFTMDSVGVNPTKSALSIIKKMASAQNVRLQKKVAAMQKTIDKNNEIIKSI